VWLGFLVGRNCMRVAMSQLLVISWILTADLEIIAVEKGKLILEGTGAESGKPS